MPLVLGAPCPYLCPYRLLAYLLLCLILLPYRKGTKPNKAPPEPNGLIYHIPFNEGKGSKAAVFGSKGGASPAAFMRGANWDVGAHGAALKLDGKTNYALG